MALLGGLWLGVTPAVTKLHLDGFYAQVGGLFVLPAVLATRSLFVQTVLLAYLYCAYTEFYPLALAMVLAMRLISKEFVPAIAIPVLSLGMSLPWLLRSFHMLGQHVAMTSVPWLEVLFPFAGSLKGWALLFFAPPLPLFAAGLGVLSVSAFFSQSLRKRLQLGLITCLAIGSLSLVASGHYLFWKLSAGLIWLWVFVVVLGLVRLGSLVPRKWRLSHYPATLVILLLTALSVRGYLHEMKGVIRGSGNLLSVDTPQLRQTYRYLEEHPNETFVISEENPIVVGWLAYHGRKANIFLNRSVMAEHDPDLAPAGLPFFRLPANGTIIDRTRITGAGFTWRVVNPQGRDEDSSGSWYWLGDQMEVPIENLRQVPMKVDILLQVVPGPANPDPERVIALTNGSNRQEFRFSREETIKAAVELKPGLNAIRILTVRPLEHRVKFPDDPRKHMVRIDRIQVHSAP